MFLKTVEKAGKLFLNFTHIVHFIIFYATQILLTLAVFRMDVFVSDSRDDFLTFYKQTHTRFIAPVFVN